MKMLTHVIDMYRIYIGAYPGNQIVEGPFLEAVANVKYTRRYGHWLESWLENESMGEIERRRTDL